MFTGLVEETGEVAALHLSETGARLVVQTTEHFAGTQIGDSIAVNGCCLTVVDCSDGKLCFDLLHETLQRTSLAELKPGLPVNLERALAASGRFGGHFVQGHVDCTSEIVGFDPQGADYRLEVRLPSEFAPLVVMKGSIAIDGISLTVAGVESDRLTVWIIPHTFRSTNLRAKKARDAVNLEFDILAKYVERMLEARFGAKK